MIPGARMATNVSQAVGRDVHGPEHDGALKHNTGGPQRSTFRARIDSDRQACTKVEITECQLEGLRAKHDARCGTCSSGLIGIIIGVIVLLLLVVVVVCVPVKKEERAHCIWERCCHGSTSVVPAPVVAGPAMAAPMTAPMAAPAQPTPNGGQWHPSLGWPLQWQFPLLSEAYGKRSS